jgi:hypothetical protein
LAGCPSVRCSLPQEWELTEGAPGEAQKEDFLRQSGWARPHETNTRNGTNATGSIKPNQAQSSQIKPNQTCGDGGGGPGVDSGERGRRNTGQSNPVQASQTRQGGLRQV